MNAVERIGAGAGERTDIVVVGGGLAGLTTAALAAKAGRRVIVLERSSSLGGRAATMRDGGFDLNLGPHAWYVGGPGTEILNTLGVPLAGRTPRASGLFAVRGGTLHALPAGLVSLLTTDLVGLHGKLELGRVFATLTRIDGSRYRDVPLRQWLDGHLHDRDARAVVEMFMRVASYADAPEIISAGAAIEALQSVFVHNVRYLHHGWQSIVDALAGIALRHGVSIRRSRPVAELLRDGGVAGVRLQNGEVIRAAHVVLAVDPATVERLAPGAVRAADLVRAQAAVLDVALSRLPRPGNVAAFGVERPLYYSVHSATADLAPQGGHVIHVAKYLHPSQAHDATAIERELEAFMELMQPGWREGIVERRYLPSMTVTHGIPLAAKGGFAGRPQVEVSSVPGLYLAGDWVGEEGTLANAAVASAARAVGAITQRHRLARAFRPDSVHVA
jgi:phytoene dehydrogenase-like protein